MQMKKLRQGPQTKTPYFSTEDIGLRILQTSSYLTVIFEGDEVVLNSLGAPAITRVLDTIRNRSTRPHSSIDYKLAKIFRPSLP